MWHLRQAWAEKSASCHALQRWHDCRPHGAAVECSAQQRQCRCSVDLPLHTRPHKRYKRFREQSSSTWSAWSHDVEPCFFGASGFWRRALTSLLRDSGQVRCIYKWRWGFCQACAECGGAFHFYRVLFVIVHMIVRSRILFVGRHVKPLLSLSLPPQPPPSLHLVFQALVWIDFTTHAVCSSKRDHVPRSPSTSPRSPSLSCQLSLV